MTATVEERSPPLAADLARDRFACMGRRLFSIEALRGIASVSVAWFHFTNQYGWDFVRYSGSLGWLGVDVFFVISGFVIPYSLHGTGYCLARFPKFLVKRILRLEPPYLLSIALVIVLWELSSLLPWFRGSAPIYSSSQLAAHLFYSIPFTQYAWLSPVYWSLFYEFAFYLAIGLCYERLFSKSIAATILLATATAVILYILTDRWEGRIFLFVIGIAGMRSYTNIDQPKESILAIAVSAALAALFGAPESTAAGVVTIIAILWWTSADSRILVFLGSISYSLYLTHTAIGGRIINLGTRYQGGPAYELLLSLTALLVSIAFAWGFYRIIERPALAASRALVGSSRKVGSPGTEYNEVRPHSAIGDRTPKS
jgi:peptidoglycan/LPS O-acetylase OafA/YrhL